MKRLLLSLSFCVTVGVYLVHPPVVFALPCYGDHFLFYDDSECGTQVGEYGLNCTNGGYQWGTVNTDYYEEEDYCCGNTDCIGDDNCGGFGEVILCDIGTCDGAHNSAAVEGGYCNFYHF